MLNIPSSVADQLKLDSTHKNFRVVFPNGELPDITNDNIVSESVQFTESLCSQEVLKFGLTEASVLEFETVGIGNMYGMEILPYYEIDLSSLTAAQLAEIESGTWEGEYVSLDNSDLGFPYFRIPLGVFYVDSCPRNHGAMTHRRVTAYTQTVNSNRDASWGARAYFSSVLRAKTVSLFVTSWLAAAVSQEGDSGALEIGLEKSLMGSETVTISTPTSPYRYWTYTDSGGTEHQIPFMVGMYESSTKRPILLYEKPLVYSVSGVKPYLDFMQAIADFITDYYGLTETEKATITPPVYPSTKIFYRISSDNYSAQITQDNQVFYAGSVELGAADSLFTTPVSVSHVDSGTVLQAQSAEISIYRYTAPATLEDTKITVNHTLEQEKVISGVTVKTYGYANAISYAKLLAGWLELQGKFGKFGRTGNFEMDTLDASSPIAVLPGEYSECWWDEYEVSPVGAVKYSFGEDGADNTTIYQFGTGSSVYDMTDNYLLQHMANQTETTINALLDSMFIPNISDIAFTPVDLEMMGYPQMEAGDALSITAEDGTIVNTFAMRQEFAGIQMLTNTIESTGGEIIDAAGLTEEET